ncbi:MAG: hypothetical protein COV91_00100 [Candidatus Taylorbacteria bacterium CG11_big_fil_rev_8_21_14_0_20_46_11]|uniref:Phosphatidic acid phosphatase type 2/haloperoxidase domain-containing protein n=1 Tax=Candidatus Taylorbacteria bacterium CG11_big_fil_rev_8_21_14_0_20_46_11 TaxID=1975025 RepID=A0A2H0KD49_9BACT|nr:MAG: hypothetical protein COV91_00100 [Candidatus Taylorbacteria bacterium CG11_big_fil_rev_8_21_14_0_20_46_11]
MKGLFYNLKKNVINIFSRKNLAWIFLACVITYILVVSGFDSWYYEMLSGSTAMTLTFPAIAIGAIVPIFGILLFLWFSARKQSPRRINAGLAMGQAALLGYLISSTLKAFTGRIPPVVSVAENVVAVSREFQFGFWRGGIIVGWPSSHTSVAFAMALTLIILYPEKKWIRYSALLYALYIGIGVSMSVHWFSEFAAGAILGSAIGAVVGTSFKYRYETFFSNGSTVEFGHDASE